MKTNIIDFTTKFDYPFIEQDSEQYEVFNDDWLITEKGDLKCRRGGYSVWYEMLSQEDLFLHLMEKLWFDANTFLPAYLEACRRAGLDQVYVLTHF